MSIVSKYKIKVGIEEFQIKVEDIPRITKAMQTNDLVKIERGLFRGSAILAIIEEQVLITDVRPPTAEEKAKEILNTVRKDCKICFGSSYLLKTRPRRGGGVEQYVVICGHGL